jgi:hypothetical protein
MTIYAIGLFGDASCAKAAHRELDQLAERTGGSAYYPPSIAEVDAVALEYTLAYAPLSQVLDGSYRTIRVAVAGSERYSVRTRAGYRATK